MLLAVWVSSLIVIGQNSQNVMGIYHRKGKCRFGAEPFIILG